MQIPVSFSEELGEFSREVSRSRTFSASRTDAVKEGAIGCTEQTESRAYSPRRVGSPGKSDYTAKVGLKDGRSREEGQSKDPVVH